ncbi:DUF998 domain-containing protein [Nocardia sp. CNY236]|uniref:DUF998 domain-containing protein n=1 Tax=Nocardia sp. CNY236 TaxID=1169152 RepID=UPI000405346C|nr:DUF998 domain-containing protein [Nocardia sp. CNY236]
MTGSPEIAEQHTRVALATIATSLAIAGVCYSSWVLEFVLPIHGDPAHSFLSELAMEGKPYREVFTTADAIAGVLLISASVTAIMLFPRHRLTTVGWLALGCFGASTIADVLLPLRDHASSAPFSQLHQPHAMASTLAVTSIAVAALSFGVAAFRYRRWRILREFGFVSVVIGSIATIWMLFGDNYSPGIAQRIQIGAISSWLLALAVTMIVEGSDWTDPTTLGSRV